MTEDGPEATKAPRGRKAKAVPEEGSVSSVAATDPDPQAEVAEEAADPQTKVAQDIKLPEEPTVTANASHTAE